MTLLTSQDTLIETELLRAVEKHPDFNKTDIITYVVDELMVPRPTVRRVKKQLLVKLNQYVDVLT